MSSQRPALKTAGAAISDPDSENPNNKETCNNCDFSCDNEEDPTCHREETRREHVINNSEDLFVCNICYISYTCQDVLMEHCDNMHLCYNNYSCDQCDFVAYG